MRMELPRWGQWRSVRSFGVLVGLLLLVGMALVLANDRHNRLAAAQRQALVLTTSTERLLRFEFRNLERAMLGIAADGNELFRKVPEQAPGLLGDAIRGVVGRHGEIESIVVLDALGEPLTPGRGDPGLSRWTVPAARGEGHQLYVGPLEPLSGGGWVLKLAIRMDDQGWLLARLRTDELQSILGGLDLGHDGVLSVLRPDGTIIARMPDPLRMTGKWVPPAIEGENLPHHAVALGSRPSRVDGRIRVAAASVLPDYPVLVFASLDQAEVLAPWRMFLAVASALLVVYALGLVYLLRSLRRAERRQAQLVAEVRASDEELRLAHHVGGIGTWWIGPDGTRLHCSAQTVEMFALPRASMPVGRFLVRVHADDRARVLRTVRQAWHDGSALDITCRIRLGKRGERWIAARGAIVDGAASGRRMTGTVVDISERIESQALALDAQRQFRLIFELNPLPCWLFDVQTLMFLEVNPAAVRQYGYSREELLAMRITEIRPPQHVEEIVRRVREPDASEAGTSLVTVHRHRDGSLIDVRVHTSELEIGGARARLVLAENISEAMAHQRELAHRASHDAATGLLNVRALADLLDQSGPARYTIAHIQLRGLQLIGDTLGREVGDDVMQRLCRQLQALADGYGWLAFQPSEDFVVAIDDRRDAGAALEALEALLSGPVRGRDSLHPLDLHIGVAAFPQDGADAEDVIGKAAQAAHAAREGGNSVQRFAPEIATRLGERLRLVGRLHEAIDRGEFELHYQPIVAAADGRPEALEALVRWRRPGHGLVPPGEFIQLCEDTGLILPLGRWAIRQAARDRRWLASQVETPVPVAINVSAVHFHGSDVAADVVEACRDQGLDFDCLHVELTESSLLREPLQALQAMQRLHAHGVCISLDDFGTGFSSMAYLQSMPLDSLKIDRTFVRDVDSDARSASICRAMLTMGRTLGLKVIAEGVERPAQREWLRGNGCDQLQGFLIGRPAPLPELVANWWPLHGRGDAGSAA